MKGWLSWFPPLVIFGVPSIAALVINCEDRWPLPNGMATSLEAAWFIGALLTLASLSLLLLAGRKPQLAPPARASPRLEIARCEVTAVLADGRRLAGTLTLSPQNEEPGGELTRHRTD